MQKYFIIKTTEDKAGFIADNMKLEYDGIDFDGVIIFYCILDKTIYSVTDFYGNSCFFETYHEALNYFDDIVEDMQDHFDEYVVDENSIMTISKNHISFTGAIRGDDIDTWRMEELFDGYAFKEVEFILNCTLRNGDVEVTFADYERG